MFETLDKMMTAGLGAMTMTKEKAEKIFDEYVAKGQAAKDSRTGFVKEVMDSAEKTRGEFEKMINEQVRKVIDSMNLATKEDIQRLEDKIDSMKQQ
jgi:polyhydroxyalkanoate synthesis regulator phasin